MSEHINTVQNETMYFKNYYWSQLEVFWIFYFSLDIDFLDDEDRYYDRPHTTFKVF